MRGRPGYRGAMIRRFIVLVLVAFGTGGCASAPSGPDAAAGSDYLAHARSIHREAPLVDGHNDLPWELRKQAGGDLAKMDFRGPLSGVHTDLPRLKAGGVGGV